MSYTQIWERRSLVRARPRRLLAHETGYFYPVLRQPLCFHPEVIALGQETRDYILTQSFYKYSHDILMIETSVVSQILLDILLPGFILNFDREMQLSLLSVVVDEGYHAYVALDCMGQIEQITGIKPLVFPKETELLKAIQSVKLKLAFQYHDIFKLIAVCIAESTLTKEMIGLTDEKELNPFFSQIIQDHLSDEARHVGLFQKVLTEVWSKLDCESKNAIGSILVEFLKLYLTNETQKDFDRKILQSLKFESIEIQKIIEETHANYKVNGSHPMVQNILKSFKHAGLFDHPETKSVFAAAGWFL